MTYSISTDSSLITSSVNDTEHRSSTSMTTTSSNRRLHGRRESNTIPIPRVHSSLDTNRKSKRIILEPNDIIIEANKNVNHYIPSIPEFSLEQSEEMIKMKYTDLLINFFQTRQPSYIFEPLRKEYYWTDEPFDQEKITRLEK